MSCSSLAWPPPLAPGSGPHWSWLLWAGSVKTDHSVGDKYDLMVKLVPLLRTITWHIICNIAMYKQYIKNCYQPICMLLGLMHSFYTILWVMSKTNPAQTTTSFPRQLWFTLTYVLYTSILSTLLTAYVSRRTVQLKLC